MTARRFRIVAHAETHAETEAGTRAFELHGREAWTLLELVKAGPSGITSRGYPGVRLAAHVFNLRQIGGFDTSTRHESYAGPFRGLHGRYVLENDVAVEWPDDEGEAAQ